MLSSSFIPFIYPRGSRGKGMINGFGMRSWDLSVTILSSATHEYQIKANSRRMLIKSVYNLHDPIALRRWCSILSTRHLPGLYSVVRLFGQWFKPRCTVVVARRVGVSMGCRRCTGARIV